MTHLKRRQLLGALAWPGGWGGVSAAWAAASAYDPSAAPPAAGDVLDLAVADARRRRVVPIRVYLPTAVSAPSPVVLFSHGLGGSRSGNAYLGRHWSARGLVVVVVQHPGSDEGVWKDVAPARRMAAMKRAASVQNLLLRCQDIGVVLDQLQAWNDAAAGAGADVQGDPRAAAQALAGRLDLTRIGMSGHSFGALTTQAVSGQSLPDGGPRFTDPRIRAAVAFSPSAPRQGDAEAAFASVRIPWLLMTGTRDEAPIGGQTVASRLAVFPALPPGDKFELVLDQARHSAFTDHELPDLRAEPRDPRHHRAILAVTSAFWDAYLRNDASALRWLKGEGVRGVLAAADRWQAR